MLLETSMAPKPSHQQWEPRHTGSACACVCHRAASSSKPGSELCAASTQSLTGCLAHRGSGTYLVRRRETPTLSEKASSLMGWHKFVIWLVVFYNYLGLMLISTNLFLTEFVGGSHAPSEKHFPTSFSPEGLLKYNSNQWNLRRNQLEISGQVLLFQIQDLSFPPWCFLLFLPRIELWQQNYSEKCQRPQPYLPELLHQH